MGVGGVLLEKVYATNAANGSCANTLVLRRPRLELRPITCQIHSRSRLVSIKAAGRSPPPGERRNLGG